MAYAQGRVINDADSHIMESLDWLPSYADPGIRDRLVSLRLEAGGSGAAKAIERFESGFEGFSEATKDRFCRRNFEDMFAG